MTDKEFRAHCEALQTRYPPCCDRQTRAAVVPCPQCDRPILVPPTAAGRATAWYTCHTDPQTAVCDPPETVPYHIATAVAYRYALARTGETLTIWMPDPVVQPLDALI